MESSEQAEAKVEVILHSKDVDKESHPPHIPLRIWTILFISSFGVFMASVSTSALIIAFPILLIDLRMTINTMMWVLLVLLLMIGAVVPVAGKLGDIVGQGRIYKIGYWCFVIGSLGAGFVDSSNKGFDLVAARIVIGFGAALLFTNSSAILTNSFAPYQKVGLSQGVFGLCAALGIVLGPLIGGAFATSNWRWIFWFNVPPGTIHSCPI
jgi:MFS family permease